jgi:hypothetical protein
MKPMTAEQKIKLIARVQKEAYKAFESFNEDGVGAGLAYLYAAIAGEGKSYDCSLNPKDNFEQWLLAAMQTTWGRPLRRYASVRLAELPR